jgi:hypothetical protein
MADKNITVSLSEEDLRSAQLFAAKRGTSVSQLLTQLLGALIEQETGYPHAKERSLTGLRNNISLGTGGHITSSRDSVHER